jgi:hypothetical protein
VVNSVVVSRTTVVNVENIRVYRNMSAKNAVVAVPPQRFARDHVAKARIHHVDVSKLRPVHGTLPVKPMAPSVVPGDGSGSKPFDVIQKSRVAATRQHPVFPAASQVLKHSEPSDRALAPTPGAVKAGKPAESPAPLTSTATAEFPGRGRPGAPLGVEAPALQKPARAEGPTPLDRQKPPVPTSGGFRREPMVSAPERTPVHPGPRVAPSAGVFVPPPEAGRPRAQSPARESKVVPPDLSSVRPASVRSMPPPHARRVEPIVARPVPIRSTPPVTQGSKDLATPAVRASDADDGARKPPGPAIPSSGQADVRGSRKGQPARPAIRVGRDVGPPAGRAAAESKRKAPVDGVD